MRTTTTKTTRLKKSHPKKERARPLLPRNQLRRPPPRRHPSRREGNDLIHTYLKDHRKVLLGILVDGVVRAILTLVEGAWWEI